MAAMSGSLLVDPGSGDDEDLYNNLYVSPSMVNAEDRFEHLNPYVSLSKNLRRTHTPPTFDYYSDTLDEPDTSFGLHSVAHSVHQARMQQYMEAAGSTSSQSPNSVNS